MIYTNFSQPLSKKKKSNKHMLKRLWHFVNTYIKHRWYGCLHLKHNISFLHSYRLKQNLWNIIQGEKKRNSIGSSMHAFLCTVIIAKQSKILISSIKGPFLNHCLLESESIMIGLGSIINHTSPPGPCSMQRKQVDIWTCGVLIGR